MHVTLLTIWTMRAFKEDAVAAEDFKRVAHCVRSPISCSAFVLPESAGGRVCLRRVGVAAALPALRAAVAAAHISLRFAQCGTGGPAPCHSMHATVRRADQCVAANALQSKLIRAFFEASCSRTTYRHGTR